MYLRQNPTQALECYQSLDLASRLDGASPYAVVSVLYVELAQALDVMLAARQVGRLDTSNRFSARAQTILISLGASLDFERGGEIAASLAQIYRSMSAELRKAAVENDPARLARVRTGVSDLLDAWNKLT